MFFGIEFLSMVTKANNLFGLANVAINISNFQVIQKKFFFLKKTAVINNTNCILHTHEHPLYMYKTNAVNPNMLIITREKTKTKIIQLRKLKSAKGLAPGAGLLVFVFIIPC